MEQEKFTDFELSKITFALRSLAQMIERGMISGSLVGESAAPALFKLSEKAERIRLKGVICKQRK